MGKISSKQIFTYVLLLCIIGIAAVYMLVYKKNSDLAKETRDNNEVLAKRVESLKIYHDNQEQYLKEMEPLKEDIKTMLEPYPADILEEDAIMQAVMIQKSVPIVYTAVNIGEKGVFKSISEDTVKKAGMEEFQTGISFAQRKVTYPNNLSYSELKQVIQALFDSHYPIGISNITYAPAGEDLLGGVLDLVFYSASGTGKEYVKPDITPYISGTENIFANVEE